MQSGRTCPKRLNNSPGLEYPRDWMNFEAPLSSMKILHTADWHLGKKLNGFPGIRNRYLSSMKSASWPTNIALTSCSLPAIFSTDPIPRPNPLNCFTKPSAVCRPMEKGRWSPLRETTILRTESPLPNHWHWPAGLCFWVIPTPLSRLLKPRMGSVCCRASPDFWSWPFRELSFPSV